MKKKNTRRTDVKQVFEEKNDINNSLWKREEEDKDHTRLKSMLEDDLNMENTTIEDTESIAEAEEWWIM